MHPRCPPGFWQINALQAASLDSTIGAPRTNLKSFCPEKLRGMSVWPSANQSPLASSVVNGHTEGEIESPEDKFQDHVNTLCPS